MTHLTYSYFSGLGIACVSVASLFMLVAASSASAMVLPITLNTTGFVRSSQVTLPSFAPFSRRDTEANANSGSNTTTTPPTQNVANNASNNPSSGNGNNGGAAAGNGADGGDGGGAGSVTTGDTSSNASSINRINSTVLNIRFGSR